MVSWDAVFAADFHLQASDPEGIALACRFVDTCALRTRRIYLLGDVFDFWTSRALLRLLELRTFFDALRSAAANGTELYFLPGNRDFNLNPAVGAEIGLRVCGEDLSVRLSERSILLTHGDRFLLNDRSYQRFKKVIRSAPARFLAQNMPGRISCALARRLRRYSSSAVARKRSMALAIVESALKECFADGFDWVICGHVHRPQRRDYDHRRSLYVLPALQEAGEFAVLKDGRLELSSPEGESRPFPQIDTGGN